MKNVIKKITAAAMAFTLFGAGNVITSTVAPQFSNTTITASAAGYQTSYVYYTTANDLRLRQGPGTQYGLVKNGNVHVKPYETFKVTQVNGSWGYCKNVKLKEGGTTTAWVHLGYCRYISPKKNGTKRTVRLSDKNGTLNVRSGPSTSCSAVGSRRNGATVYVYGTSNGWSCISPSGNLWVSSSYLR